MFDITAAASWIIKTFSLHNAPLPPYSFHRLANPMRRLACAHVPNYTDKYTADCAEESNKFQPETKYKLTYSSDAESTIWCHSKAGQPLFLCI